MNRIKIEDIKEIALQLVAEAKKDKINISNVYLFGSYAKGNALNIVILIC